MRRAGRELGGNWVAIAQVDGQFSGFGRGSQVAEDLTKRGMFGGGGFAFFLGAAPPQAFWGRLRRRLFGGGSAAGARPLRTERF